jgi:hypothetical protein
MCNVQDVKNGSTRNHHAKYWIRSVTNCQPVASAIAEIQIATIMPSAMCTSVRHPHVGIGCSVANAGEDDYHDA